jgi:hypothetical protein
MFDITVDAYFISGGDRFWVYDFIVVFLSRGCI